MYNNRHLLSCNRTLHHSLPLTGIILHCYHFMVNRDSHYTPAFTGCASQSASPSNWLSWRTDQSTALPTYLQSCFTRVVNMTSRRRLRSSASHRLEVGLPPFDSLHQQTGVPSCRRQHVERPSAPRHIFTVTRGLHTASQDFPLLSFLRGHPDMTNLLLLIIIVFLFFWHYLAITDII